MIAYDFFDGFQISLKGSFGQVLIHQTLSFSQMEKQWQEYQDSHHFLFEIFLFCLHSSTVQTVLEQNDAKPTCSFFKGMSTKKFVITEQKASCNLLHL